MKTNMAIHTETLSKDFGDRQAVRQVSLDVQQGEILSLLGPNGAGKSTLISMLACLLKPTSGDAWVMGHSITREPMAVKSAIGVVPQEVALYPDLTARENLIFWGKMYGLRGTALSQRAAEVMEIIGLEDRKGPSALAVVPASLVSVLLIVGGIAIWSGLAQMAAGLAAGGAEGIGRIGEIIFQVGPTLLFPVWGAALAVATLGYYYRRRGPCSVCGLGAGIPAGDPAGKPTRHTWLNRQNAN